MAPSGGSLRRDLLAAPNIVSLARVCLLAPALGLVSAGMRLWAALVVVVLFATDGLDGFLARRLDRVTELGKILDPTADKVAVGAILLYLVAVGEFPLWALLLVVARDLAIAAGGIAIARRSGAVPQALPAGKAALVVLAAVVVVFVADLSFLEPAALVLLCIAVAGSGAAYAVAAWNALHVGETDRRT
jgi:CDP-diacylglycerol--glycerol-3-phosphate 3-phosphatidyltransferase